MGVPIKVFKVSGAERVQAEEISEADLPNIRITAPSKIRDCLISEKSGNLNGFLSPVGITLDKQIAAENQKILILGTKEYEELKKNSARTISGKYGSIEIVEIKISFKPTSIGFFRSLGNLIYRIFPRLRPTSTARVLRAGECPNSTDTTIILIEWEKTNGATAFEEINTITGINSNSIIISAFNQLLNLIISPDPAGDPGDPIKSPSESFSSQIIKIYESQLEAITTRGLYLTHAVPCVAVLDTGLKFSNKQGASYKNKQGIDTAFSVVTPHPTCGLSATDSLGYNAVTDYLKVYNAAMLGVIPSDPSWQIYDKVITKIQANGLTREQIINTPYDDNLVDEIDETGCLNPMVGRHGTIISAIINQRGNVPVLPVKIFNAAGYGTFFDLICGLNYVLGQKKAGLNIQTLNASFVGSFLENSGELDFLKRKFEEITAQDIWIIAAAGNEDVDLGRQKKYPACFPLDKIITVGTSTQSYLLRRLSGPQSNPQLPINDTLLTILNLPAVRRLTLSTNLEVIRDTNWISSNNLSSQFVHIAVGNLKTGTDEFPSPFQNGADTFTGTSIAVAYASAAVVLFMTHSRDRDTLIDNISNGGRRDSLITTVKGGHLLLIDEPT